MVEEDWWPCDKRVAHGPHYIDAVYVDRRKVEGTGYWCQGVKAHPNTMIGRTKVAGS